MKVVSKYFTKRKEAINTILKKPRSKYYPGTYHKLRVEIKKLNALFELTNFCSKDFKQKKTFQPFKDIFDQAGMVRELQVEEAILRSYRTSSLKYFKNELRKLRIDEQKKYFSISDRKFHILLNQKFDIVESFLSKIDNKKTEKFIKRKSREISQLLKKKTSRMDQLHELRKQLKILNYIRMHLSDERSKFENRKDVLSSLLGKWHDCEVILEHFDRVLKNRGLNSKTKSKLREIKSVIKTDFNKLHDRINRAIDQSEFN